MKEEEKMYAVEVASLFCDTITSLTSELVGSGSFASKVDAVMDAAKTLEPYYKDYRKGEK